MAGGWEGKRRMKSIRCPLRTTASVVSVSLLLLSASSPAKVSSHLRHSFTLTAVNPTNISRHDEIVEISMAEVKKKFPSLNEQAFSVFCRHKEVSYQLSLDPIRCIGNEVANSSELVFVSSFASHEQKRFSIVWDEDTVEEHHFPLMTQAALGVKTKYDMVDGYYMGGTFVDVDSSTVPRDHFAHDGLYRIEGPGWESDKIVYRFYLDSRNRSDIFGKKTHDLVLKRIGENDLTSDSKESYTKMLDWGMDIFKVGESLGIGSIAMWHDSRAVTVSDVSRAKCSVFSGPIRSGVFTSYLGWKVGDKVYDLFTELSISAGSRLTGVVAFVNNDSVQLCTGLAKHEACDLIKSPRPVGSVWEYLALYGKQSLSGDNLGIAVFYREKDKVKLAEDSTSTIVVLRPTAGRITYYLGAAWEQEPGGIKNEKSFKRFLSETVLKLDHPIQTYF